MYDSRVENVREKAINWFCSSRPEFSFHTVGMVNLDLWRWMVISSKYEMCWIVIGSKMRRQESAFNLSTDLLKVQSSKFFELPWNMVLSVPLEPHQPHTDFHQSIPLYMPGRISLTY
jgi:hypothetical protein